MPLHAGQGLRAIFIPNKVIKRVRDARHLFLGRQFSGAVRKVVKNVDYRQAKLWMGLPRQFKENFASQFRGQIHVSRPGTYTFYTTSDDGSGLYIAGRKVVKND